MEIGNAEFPDGARGGGGAGNKGDQEDGVGKTFDDHFHLLLFHLISHSHNPIFLFCLKLHPEGYKITVTACSLLQQYFHLVVDEQLVKYIPIKRRKKPRSKFCCRVRGGQQKASATFLGWTQHITTNPPIPAIPPGTAPISNPNKSKTKQQLIG